MGTFARKYEKNLIAFTLAFCMLCGFLLSPQMYKASSMVQVDNGIIGITQWSRVYNSGSWVENSSIPPKATDKDYCWRFSINSSVSTSGKPFCLSFDRCFYLGNGYGTSVSFYEIDYAFRDGTRVVVTDLSRVYTSGQNDSNSYTYHFFSKTFNKDLAYIDVYFRIGCTCTDCTHYVTNYNIMMPEETVQEVIKKEIKVSNNILDNIKSMVSYIGNLPSNIANSLKNFFDNLPGYIETGNVALKTAFNSGMDALKSSLPSGIKNALSPLFEGVRTAVNGVYDGVGNVVTSITNLPGNIGGFFTNLGTTIGGFFDNLSGGFFDLSAEDEALLDSVDPSKHSHEEIQQSINDVKFNASLATDLKTDSFLHDDSINLTRSVMGFVINFEYVPQFLFIAVSLGAIAFAFFGKR